MSPTDEPFMSLVALPEKGQTGRRIFLRAAVERILGLSKFARVVELHARDLQIREWLTVQIADWLEQHLTTRIDHAY